MKHWLYKKKVEYLYRYRKGGDLSVENDILNMMSKSFDEINDINFTRFQKLVAYAYDHSPFYREKYQKAGLNPNDIKSPDDIEKIPILTRDEVKENRERILCDNVDSKTVFLTSTGGSTGTPLFFYHEHKEPFPFIKWRFLKSLGISPDENSAIIMRRTNNFVNRMKESIWNWPTKLIYLNAMMITKESISKFIEEANRFNIKYLWGYEGGLHHLASFLQENDLSIPSIACVISTSSPLPDSHRELYNKVFHCDVYDQYGSCEVQWLATECPKHHGLHIFWDERRIEFVDQEAKNVPLKEYGDIVVTDLRNYSFPFIRYKNGDRGRLLSYSSNCDIPFPLMDSVKGRTTDIIRFQDGSCITGEYLTTLFDACPLAVKAFQVVQKKDYSLELRYVPSERIEAETEIETVFSNLKKLVGNRANIVGIKVANISHDRGKTRYVISELSS